MDPTASEAHELQAGESLAAERPDWLEANFNSVEDQARAYGHARQEMQAAQRDRAQAQEVVEMLAAQMEAQAQAPPPPPPQYGGENPLVDRYEEALAAGDGASALATTAFVAEQIAQRAIAQYAAAQQSDPRGHASSHMFAGMVEQEARMMFGDDQAWDDLKEEAGAILAERPNLLRETSDPRQAAGDLVDIMHMVQARRGTAPASANPAPPQGIEGALQEAGLTGDRAKRLSQTLAGAGARVVQSQDDDAAYAQRIRDSRLNEWPG